MSKRELAIVVRVMEALKANNCIDSYRVEGEDVHPEWEGNGFERALREFTASRYPFGLKTRMDRAWLYIVLARNDKEAMDDLVIGSIKQQYRL